MNSARLLLQIATIFCRSDKVQRQLAIRTILMTERTDRLPEWNDEDNRHEKSNLDLERNRNVDGRRHRHGRSR